MTQTLDLNTCPETEEIIEISMPWEDDNVLQFEKLSDGNVLVIKNDECNESPREWDNLGTFYTFMNRYNSPDNCQCSFEEELGNLGSKSLYHLVNKNKDYIALGVYGYSHGRMFYNTVGFGCPWDSGVAGIIYVSAAKVREEYDKKRISKKVREMVLEILKQEVEVYSHWANGEVYRYEVYNAAGEQLDSCGSFYGIDDILSEFRLQ